MEQIERELYDMVSEGVYELTWRCNFPINPNIGLWAFLEAFKSYGAKTTEKEDKIVFDLEKIIKGKRISLQSSISKNEIVQGWGWNPIGSPRALYESICENYDRLGKVISGQELERAWQEERMGEARRIRAKMEDFLEPFFPKYQEHLLVPVSELVPKLNEPRLFKKVLDEFPTDILQMAKIMCHENERSCGPCPATILDQDWSEYDINEYHPSESAMIDYFWGHYLYSLAQEKGYQINGQKVSKTSLPTLVENGWHSFDNGSLTFQTPHKTN